MKTTTVGTKGQIVIPKRIRDELGIHAGQRVAVEQVEGTVRVRRLLALESLRGALVGVAGGTPDVEAEHREELAREEERARR